VPESTIAILGQGFIASSAFAHNDGSPRARPYASRQYLGPSPTIREDDNDLDSVLNNPDDQIAESKTLTHANNTAQDLMPLKKVKPSLPAASALSLRHGSQAGRMTKESLNSEASAK